MISQVRKSPRGRLGSALLAFVLLILSIQFSLPAKADPYGTGTAGAGLMTASLSPKFCLGSTMSANEKLTFRAAATYVKNNTIYSLTESSQCAGVVLPSFWVRRDSSMGSLTRGYWQCVQQGFGKCSRANIGLNPTLLVNPINRRKTSCHELGHGLGLKHHNAGYGCMKSGSVSVATTTYVAHHLTHISKRTVATS